MVLYDEKIGSYDRSDRNDRKILSELCVFYS
ncbi:Uncharacterised protein [uncultured Bacteroides sp.]|nr:Uncharacterised protein [uncultured Bacteroides sp.]